MNRAVVHALRWLGAIAVLGLGTACSSPPPQPRLPPGQHGTDVWRARRGALDDIRKTFDAGRPYSLNVTLELWVERLGMRTRGRGAVAVHPPHGVRMIMLGPGGTTAMDLWICRDKFRFAVPAADLVRRGDASTPPDELSSLPVDFLRWWFLEPLGGSLLAAFPTPEGDRFVLRDRDAGVHLLAGKSSPAPLSVRRIANADVEEIETTAALCGDVHYKQKSTSIDLAVHCEKLNDGIPPARAFADPDDPDIACFEDDS